ncbi:MAG: hypothetical protein H7315_04370 [Herminiimonas sp.]|nr:hypothetical protein [Herminiimonas sp.]
MSSVESPRPAKLYHHAEPALLERALSLGEFRLQPPVVGGGGQQILPFKSSAPRSVAQYLTLILHMASEATPFDAMPGAECCLVIHDTEQFGERLHRAVRRALPNWAGIDAAVSYGVPSPLGEAFSRPKQEALRKEWLFAWRPIQATMSLSPVIIQIGSLDGIAQLRQK